ncbi:hypothetical protein BBO_08226 [Beauveria brongniartii RCEF 3172]|uniref:Uncharacterized protein n=1 Tax=Beauveria brongniartii RCEF 3172 TaxID=1081107 RepID=A0A166XYZ3_9HYPO|nr:hypothetical protein BBO_08226 [Beauveria brongniartii RCEF 3172]
MAPAGIEQAANKQSTTPTRFFPEWTQEDDSDVEIASIAQRQRVRFRAASVAGRQRYQSPPRDELLSRRDVSQEAHEIRAMLQGRKLKHLAKGLGAARSTIADGVGAAVDAVAEGISNSGSAAASAFAGGEGVAGAASAAAGAVSDGIHKGASAAAEAVASAGGAFASAVEDSVEDGSKTSTTTKYDAPSPTQDPPQVTEAPPSPSPSPTYYSDPVPPEITDGPVEDVPPPKAEQPPDDTSGESGFSSSAESYSASSSDEAPTPTDGSQKISLSTLVPGATVTGPSGTRLQLTPILTSPLPAATSGIKKGTTARNNDTTAPFVVAPDRTTMIVSISPTSNMAPDRTGGPIADLNRNGPDREESGGGGGGGGGGLSTGGQDAVMSIGVLIGVSAAVALAYFLWRRRKRIINPNCVVTGGGGDSPKDLFKSTLGRTKRGLVNVARRIPYLRDKIPRENRWDNLGDPYGDFFTEKSLSAANDAAASAGFDPAVNENRKLEPVTIQTSFTRTTSAASQFNSTAGVGGTFSSVGVSTVEASALGISSVAEANARAAEPGSDSRGLSPFADPADDTAPTSPTAMPPARSASQARHLAGGASSHGPKPSLSSTALEYNLTLPSAPGARRISDLSSLSSGFGDGDIFVPSKQARKSSTSSKLQKVISNSDSNSNSNNNNSNNNSSSNNRHSTATTVTTTTTRGGDTRRDTVFTEASEDSPPRFRTVSSWVRQQSGRVKREKQREQDAADESGTPPPVPPIPPEQDFRLMMPDGEVPRRVEDTETGEGGGDWGSQTRSVLSGTIGAAR